MDELRIEYIDIDKITPYENNARKHQKTDVDAIKKSIESFGMNDPIGVWSDKNIIVEGHGRLIALKELGYKKVPCIRLDRPSNVLKERIQEDNVPYDIWVEKGYITLTEGSQNDFSLVTQWFRSMIDKYDIRPLWVGYDPWNSQYWVKEMEDMGFEMEKIRQGVYTLSEPMKQLEADLRNHALNYNNNPIIKWCLANTQAKVDVNGNIQPSKLNSRLKRIDGTVATIIAYATLSRYKLDYEAMVK